MEIENPKFLGDILTDEPSSIHATVDGILMTIPIDPENRHYSELMRQVEAGDLSIEAAEPIVSPPRHVGTSREFLKLFTREERLAFWQAEASSPELKDWWAMASTGSFWLGHPDVADGLKVLVSLSILTVERVNEILASDFDQA